MFSIGKNIFDSLFHFAVLPSWKQKLIEKFGYKIKVKRVIRYAEGYRFMRKNYIYRIYGADDVRLALRLDSKEEFDEYVDYRNRVGRNTAFSDISIISVGLRPCGPMKFPFCIDHDAFGCVFKYDRRNIRNMRKDSKGKLIEVIPFKQRKELKNFISLY